MKHPTTKVDGVAEQHKAQQLADRLETRNGVDRTRISEDTCIWAYTSGGFIFPDFMFEAGYVCDYAHSSGHVTFVPKEETNLEGN